MPAAAVVIFYLDLPWSGPSSDEGVPVEQDGWVGGVTDIRAIALTTENTKTGFSPVNGWEVGYRGDISISITYLSDLTTLTVEVTYASGTVTIHTQELTGSLVVTFQPTEDIVEILVGGRGFSITDIRKGIVGFWTNFKGQSEIA